MELKGVKDVVIDTKSDKNGRVYIPSVIRRMFNLQVNSRMDIKVGDGCIVLFPRNEK